MGVREYFSFSRRERTGIIALVVILLIVCGVSYFARRPSWVSGEDLPPPYAVSDDTSSRDQRIVSSFDRNNRESVRAEDQRYDDRRAADHIERPVYQKRQSNWRNTLPRARDPVTEERKKYTWNGDRRSFAAPRTPIDINRSDTTAFIALPGIGSKLANRIVAYRSKLGGFDSVGQIRNVYGLKDSVFDMLKDYLKCDPGFSKGQ